MPPKKRPLRPKWSPSNETYSTSSTSFSSSNATEEGDTASHSSSSEEYPGALPPINRHVFLVDERLNHTQELFPSLSREFELLSNPLPPGPFQVDISNRRQAALEAAKLEEFITFSAQRKVNESNLYARVQAHSRAQRERDLANPRVQLMLREMEAMYMRAALRKKAAQGSCRLPKPFFPPDRPPDDPDYFLRLDLF